jgi:isopentenyl phosphate kinase
VLGSLTVRNLPAVLVSPWPYTCAIRDGSSGKTILPERDEGLLDVTTRLLQDGFIPVLHGDVILNNLELSVKNGACIEDLGREPLYRTKPTRTEPLARDARCTILSGDRLALMLAKYLPTKLEGQEEKLSSVSCVFLTDVEGVYDSFPDNSRTSQPKPSRQGGGIIREILVSRGGDGQVAFSSPLPQIQDTAAGRPDVTGGITGKLNAASQVAALGVPVHIVQAGSESALEALGGLEPRIGTTVKLETCTQKVQREYAQI